MTAIWHEDGNTWKLLSPSDFPDEAKLQSLVEDAPHTLPLSGTPGLVILGREVRLGTSFVDLLAVEANGRPAIIEIKLARNAEARRAVVAQVLAYAAALDGLSVEELEVTILRTHLATRGYSDIGEAVEASDQIGQVERASFYRALSTALREGNLRLVMVLDSIPDELARLVSFLERKAERLVIDLIRMSAFDIGGTTILVPQRIEPAHRTPTGDDGDAPERQRGELVEGADDFEQGCAYAGGRDKEVFAELIAWARSLATRGLAQLYSYHCVRDRMTLLPKIQPDNAGFATVWNDRGPALQLWRSVFERRAPESLRQIDAILAPDSVRQGMTLRDIPDGLLPLLTMAYEEAAGLRSVDALKG